MQVGDSIFGLRASKLQRSNLLRKSAVTHHGEVALQWITLKPILANPRTLFALDLVSAASIESMHSIYVALCYYFEGRTVKPTAKAIFSRRKVRRIDGSSEIRDKNLSKSGDDDSAKSNSDSTNPNVHHTTSSPKLKKCRSSLSESGEAFPLWKV